MRAYLSDDAAACIFVKLNPVRTKNARQECPPRGVTRGSIFFFASKLSFEKDGLPGQARQ
jgi:hypothetical protein